MKNALILAAAFAALNGRCDIRALTPDNYGGKPNVWQMNRHNEKKVAITNGGAKVVFVGDSITHFWDSTGKVQQKKYFSAGDYKMLDLGIAADRTEHVLWRLRGGRELDGYEAKVVLLMIGTNNTGHFPIEKEPPADTILGIRAILKEIRHKQPKAKIVLTAIFPRGRDAADAFRVRNEVVNREIQKFADGQTIFWCDFNDQFLTPDGELSPELFPDYLHPSADGYEIWHAAVRPYVDAALSDGKVPMPPNRFASFVRKTSRRFDQPAASYPATRIRSEGYGAFDWWLDRLMRNRNQIADSKGEIDLVMLGDSITHNWEQPGAESLAELRKTYSVLNAGYSGDCTEHLLWRLKFGGELDGYKAKVVTVMIGTNNTWHRKDQAADTAAAIKEILAVVAAKQPQAKVLLMPIFPFGASDKDAKRVVNEEINKLIRPLADGQKVVWLDFNAKFLDAKGDNVKWMPDHCHPNAAGYKEIWMPALLPYLREACGK